MVMRRLWPWLCLLIACPADGQPERGIQRVRQAPGMDEMRSEQRVALVIGNSAYAVGRLNNPANDARAMGAALRRCGFEVIEKVNSDKREMVEAIREFGSRIQKGGWGCFTTPGTACR